MSVDETIRGFASGPSGLVPKDHNTLGLADVIAQISQQGDPVPTGFAPIDRQCRGGGIPPGKLLIVGGPPESGKTTLACQILNHVAPFYPTLSLFKDEGRDQACVRIGIQLGHDRKLLERGDPAVVEALRKQLEGMPPFEFLDPDEAGMSLELAVKELERIAPQIPGKPRFLGLDSIQTIPTDKNVSDDERAGLIRFMDLARLVARQKNLIIIATSHVARAFYQSKDPKERREGSAALLGSSRLEFGGDVNVMIHPPNKDGVSRCQITKNRLRTGPSKDFYVRLDLVGTKLLEVEQGEEAGLPESLLPIEVAIKDALKIHPEGLLAGALLELAGKGVRKTAYFAARQNLIARRIIFSEQEGAGKVRFKFSVAYV